MPKAESVQKTLDGIRRGCLADRSQFYKDVASGRLTSEPTWFSTFRSFTPGGSDAP
jgi:ABC-type phosphate/phosphonate transport system ATPase subunit